MTCSNDFIDFGLSQKTFRNLQKLRGNCTVQKSSKYKCFYTSSSSSSSSSPPPPPSPSPPFSSSSSYSTSPFFFFSFSSSSSSSSFFSFFFFFFFFFSSFFFFCFFSFCSLVALSGVGLHQSIPECLPLARQLVASRKDFPFLLASFRTSHLPPSRHSVLGHPHPRDPSTLVSHPS